MLGYEQHVPRLRCLDIEGSPQENERAPPAAATTKGRDGSGFTVT